MAVSRNNRTGVHRATEPRHAVTQRRDLPQTIAIPDYRRTTGFDALERSFNIPSALLREGGKAFLVGGVASIFGSFIAAGKFADSKAGERLVNTVGSEFTTLLVLLAVSGGLVIGVATIPATMAAAGVLNGTGKAIKHTKRLAHSGIKHVLNKMGRTTGERQKFIKYLKRSIGPQDHWKHRKTFKKMSQNKALNDNEISVIIEMLKKTNIAKAIDNALEFHRDRPRNLDKLKKYIRVKDEPDHAVANYIVNILRQGEQGEQATETDGILNPMILAKEQFISQRARDLSQFTNNQLKDYVSSGPLQDDFGLAFTDSNIFEKDDAPILLANLSQGRIDSSRNRIDYCKALAEAEYAIEMKHAVIKNHKEDIAKMSNLDLKEMIVNGHDAEAYQLILSTTDEGLSRQGREDHTTLQSSLGEHKIARIREITEFRGDGGRSDDFNLAVAEAKFYIDKIAAQRISDATLEMPDAPISPPTSPSAPSREEDLDLSGIRENFTQLFPNITEEIPDAMSAFMQLTKEEFIQKRSDELFQRDNSEIIRHIQTDPLKEEVELLSVDEYSLVTGEITLLGELSQGRIIDDKRKSYCDALAKAEYIIKTKEMLIENHKEDASEMDNMSLKEDILSGDYAPYFKLILSKTDDNLTEEEKKDRNYLLSSLGSVSRIRSIANFNNHGGRSPDFNDAVAEAKYFIDHMIDYKESAAVPARPTGSLSLDVSMKPETATASPPSSLVELNEKEETKISNLPPAENLVERARILEDALPEAPTGTISIDAARAAFANMNRQSSSEDEEEKVAEPA